MRQKNSEDLAKRICHYYENITGRDRKLTRQHFMNEHIRRTTINRILERFEERGNIEYRKSPGRQVRVMTPKVQKKVKRMFKRDPETSERIVADKLELKKTTLHRIKAKKLGIKAYVKESAPKYTEDQKRRAKTNCRKLTENRLLSRSRKVLIMDDETYCPVDPKDVPGRKYYHCTNKTAVPDEIRFRGKDKFPKKYLIWQAIDEFGNVSDPYISTGTINAKTYLEECIKKRLVPFIQKYHKMEDVIFWPDMSRVHYAKVVTNHLKSIGLEFIEYENNAPKVPQARPIEKYWALCKARYKARRSGAKSLSSFKRIWSNISRKVAETSGARLMEHVRGKIRSIGRNGVYGCL